MTAKLLVFAALVAVVAASRNDPNCGVSKLTAQEIAKAREENPPTNRIVGGIDAVHGEYPWQGSLQYLGSHSCGGSFLNSRYFLTAAHCFINSNTASRYTIVGGLWHQKEQTNQYVRKYTAKRIIKHPQFSMALAISNDIALIELNEEVDFNNIMINTICLCDKGFVKYNENLTVTGWGDTQNSQGRALPDKLQVAPTLNWQSDDTCKAKWGSFSYKAEQMVCCDSKTQSPCVGDSGGPLVYYNAAAHKYCQVGVVSFGESTCAPGAARPAVFTEVMNYLDWIDQTIV